MFEISTARMLRITEEWRTQGRRFLAKLLMCADEMRPSDGLEEDLRRSVIDGGRVPLRPIHDRETKGGCWGIAVWSGDLTGQI